MGALWGLGTPASGSSSFRKVRVLSNAHQLVTPNCVRLARASYLRALWGLGTPASGSSSFRKVRVLSNAHQLAIPNCVRLARASYLRALWGLGTPASGSSSFRKVRVLSNAHQLATPNCVRLARASYLRKNPHLDDEGFCVNGALWAIRTPDPQLRRLLLYPAELRAQLVGTIGFEPTTSCSQSKRSTRLS